MSLGSTQGPTQTQQQQQQTQTNPWGPAVPALQDIIASLRQQNTGVTPLQSQAATNLTQSAFNLPNFNPQATGAVSNLYDYSTDPQIKLLQQQYGSTVGALSPFLDPSNLNPLVTPGLSDALKTNISDITNRIKGQFAAAGRSFSPDEVQALTRGITQGTSPLIASQYNKNVDTLLQAAQQAQAAGGSTALNWAQLSQMPLAAQLQALTATGSLPGLLTGPAATQLGAANTQFGLPFSNISTLENMINPIAGLGQASSGTGTSTTTSTEPLLNTLLSAGALAAGTAGAFAKSDVRFKEDIAPVGMLASGLPIYRYRYRGDPSRMVHVGLLAQEVEQLHPEAVAEDDAGMKYVDYGLATMDAANQLAI